MPSSDAEVSLRYLMVLWIAWLLAPSSSSPRRARWSPGFDSCGQLCADSFGRAVRRLILGDARAESGSVLGMPWRVVFALQREGWLLRNALIESAADGGHQVGFYS